MRSELILAINQLCAERKLSPEVVLEAVEASLISAYKRNFGATTNIEVHIDPHTGDVRVYAAREVVESVEDRKTQMSLEEARQIDPVIELGGSMLVESTPKDFGRIAAQTAKQVILQRIREAERDALYSTFADSAGELPHGTVQSVDFHSGDVVINLEGAEAVLPTREQIPTEKYRRGMRLRAYVLDVRKGNRGPQITLSRRSPAFLRRLLELEVPEIFNGSVEIKAIAREAGSRSKVAVHATQEGVDPVGSCVGVRGGRIQNVVNELGGEKIDVVQWDTDISVFIAHSLSPAKVMNVILEDGSEASKTATVIVPDRQLSLAIGKEGQNARLAAKLTGWRIDIKSATEAAEETLGRLEDIKIAPEDMDLLTLAESILRTQDATGFTVEQKQAVEQAVLGREEILSSEGELGPEVRVKVGPEQEQKSKVEPERVQEPASPASEEQRLEMEEEELPALTAALGAPGGPEPHHLGERIRFSEEQEVQVPTFEEALVEGSTGWVAIEPEQDYYSGWKDEGQALDETYVWVPEELEEEEEEGFRKGTSKKKAKKRARPARRPEEIETDNRKTKKRGGRAPR
jgi:transcription termination/antitermination protein NusA